MALQVWLPLNKEGDFQNRGLADITVTNNGATYNSSGKVGGCYNFDGVDDSIEHVTDKAALWDNKEISYACWFKSDQTKSAGTLIEIAADLCLNYRYSSSKIQFGCFRCYTKNSSRTGDYCLDSTQYDASIWHHIVITFDHQYNKLYVDGQLSAEWDKSSLYTDNWKSLLGASYNKIAIGKSHGSSSYIGGLINDVRIYDHCLSPKEVKEISKALVLHYPLNDAYVEGTTNLVTRESGSAYTNNVWGGHTYTSIVSDFSSEPIPTNVGNTITITYDSSSGLGGGVGHQLANPFTVTANTIYTYSLYIKSEDIDTCFHVNYLYFYGDTSGRSCANRNNKVYIGNGWYRYWGTFTTGSEQTTLNPYFYVYPKKNTTYYIAGAQIEQKDHMTPYVFGTRASSTVYDCSGYSNNGTITGSLSCSDDSPRYKVSTQVSNGNNINFNINPSFITTGSISFWAKYTTPGTAGTLPFSGQNGSCYIMACQTGGNFYNQNVSGTLTYYKDGVAATNPRETNVWHHFVITGINLSAWTVLYLNRYSNNSNLSWNSTAQFSDIRIYNTVLSADDVKELYNTSAMVCNNGTMLAYELEE